MKLFKSITHSGGGYNDKLKLKKYKENNSKIIVGIFLVLIVFALSVVYLYKTYAVFTSDKHFNIINGELSDPGDIYFAYYVDNKITREMPKKGTGYTLDTTKSNCTNGVVPTWDDNTYSAILNYENYNATDYTRTKCNLYFKKATYCDSHSETMACQITALAATDTTNLATDDYDNTRYIGSNPNNYVSIDGELWRIIGTMKSVDDGTGNKEDRVKLIRSESIGEYSWDTSELSVNGGRGVNEWSQADLMKLLNPGYESESVGGSLYWNNKSGTCYWQLKNSTTSCNFTSTGIKEKLKNMLGDAVWNTGSNGSNYSWNNIIASKFYELERSSNTGKICSSGDYCNDVIDRTTTWTGKVGLMYLSDYGYATSGGSTTDRATCLNKELFNWNDSRVSDCKNNDWLFNSSYQRTLSPLALSSNAFSVFLVFDSGRADGNSAGGYFGVRPVVYLSPSVVIQSGDGTSSNPFVLTLT